MTRTAPLSLDSLLLGYATGSLGTAESLLVAALLAVNESARRSVARFEAMGGRVIEEENPADVCGSCLESVLQKIAQVETPAPRARALPPSCADIPEPLLSLIAACTDLDPAPWRRTRGGARMMMIHAARTRGELFLLQMPPGGRVPPHAHIGPEITLVLEGSYSDGSGAYQKGDIAIVADDRVVHSPVAGARGCVCLMLTERPAVFEHPLDRLLALLASM